MNGFNAKDAHLSMVCAYVRPPLHDIELVLPYTRSNTSRSPAADVHGAGCGVSMEYDRRRRAGVGVSLGCASVSSAFAPRASLFIALLAGVGGWRAGVAARGCAMARGASSCVRGPARSGAQTKHQKRREKPQVAHEWRAGGGPLGSSAGKDMALRHTQRVGVLCMVLALALIGSAASVGVSCDECIDAVETLNVIANSSEHMVRFPLPPSGMCSVSLGS